MSSVTHSVTRQHQSTSQDRPTLCCPAGGTVPRCLYCNAVLQVRAVVLPCRSGPMWRLGNCCHGCRAETTPPILYIQSNQHFSCDTYSAPKLRTACPAACTAAACTACAPSPPPALQQMCASRGRSPCPCPVLRASASSSSTSHPRATWHSPSRWVH